MKLALIGALLACGAPAGGYHRAAPLPAVMTCTGDGARVVVDTRHWNATYYQDGAFVGSSECGGTRMRGYDMTCVRDPRFQVLLALVFGGQSGTLETGGRKVQLVCR